VLQHPHTVHHEMVVALDGYRGTGIPVKLSRTPGTVRRAPPAFGWDGRKILAEHGVGDDDFNTLVADGVVIADLPPH